MLARVTCKFENKKKANVDENLENKNALTAASVSLGWKLDREMRGQLILHETDLLAKGFLLTTLSTSSILQDIYFLFVSELI